MNNIIFILFSIVWILTLILMATSIGKNKTISFETEKGFKILIEEDIRMKRGTRPTRRQKEFLSIKKLDPENWLVVKDNNEYMDVVNKTSKKIRRVLK